MFWYTHQVEGAKGDMLSRKKGKEPASENSFVLGTIKNILFELTWLFLLLFTVKSFSQIFFLHESLFSFSFCFKEATLLLVPFHDGLGSGKLDA